MTRPVFFTASAKEDIRSARDWYEGEREGLGFDFVEEIRAATRRIESDPFSFAVTYRATRICPVKRFPYIVVFRITEEELEILAVIHGHRDPKVWQKRNE